MADFSRITDWAVKNAAALNISVTKQSWINEWLPGLFDYRVKLKIGKTIHIGRGIDAQENTACDKAVAEALERAAASNLSYPWATAAYPDYAGAAERAYRELVCIDRVLCHHFCRVKFSVINIETLDWNISIARLKKVLRKHELHLELCELRPVLDASVSAAFIWSAKEHRVKGIASGFGCEKRLKDAAVQAIIECLRTAIPVFFGDITPEPWEIIRTPGNPRWHFWQAQKQGARNFLVSNLLPGNNENGGLQNLENISMNDAVISEIDSLKPAIPDLPVRIAQASSPKLLRPQFGEILMDEPALRRLEIFAGASMTPEMVVPHFYD
ncbi:MAG TPA: hypothetical protein DCL44_06710 [Elusimicrobia bacterium]|nr:hypothetical protein [Elusimicrobiota bacterium]